MSYTILGPFQQLIPMRGLPEKGPIKDENLEIIPDAGILMNKGLVQEIGRYDDLMSRHRKSPVHVDHIDDVLVAMPGFIDAHTHIAFAGSREKDFALRISGASYLEIAKRGGGIWESVQMTRRATEDELEELILKRSRIAALGGVTTIEIKSGYGLNIIEELKILRAINRADKKSPLDLIATCLAAHTVPRDFAGGASEYVEYVLEGLFPVIKNEKLARRADIFVEKEAFDMNSAEIYCRVLRNRGFGLTIHADQFTTGGSDLAIKYNALSADHLESSTNREIENLAKSSVVPIALPGASIGLGMRMTPARKLLDAGASLAIASDWNPGSAPMGHLLTVASILATFEKLSTAEIFAGLTFRAGLALGLPFSGMLNVGRNADIIAFPCSDYREILYHQGRMNPTRIWKRGMEIRHIRSEST